MTIKKIILFYCIALIYSCKEEKSFDTASLDVKKQDYFFEDIITAVRENKFDTLVQLKISLRNFSSQIKVLNQNINIFYSVNDSGDTEKLTIYYFEKIEASNGRITSHVGDSLIRTGLTCSKFELSFTQMGNYTTTLTENTFIERQDFLLNNLVRMDKGDWKFRTTLSDSIRTLSVSRISR